MDQSLEQTNFYDQDPRYNSSSGSSGPGGPPRTGLTDTKRETRRRTKTGCLTCRKRRIKCDEGKPDCLRCVKSKRHCEGYSMKTVFRNENAMHYQQNIRPVPTTHHMPEVQSEHIQFSMPQYQVARGAASDKAYHPIVNGVANAYPMVQPNMRITIGDPASRNSSASNASGVSGSSEQRRISVLSLMTPVHEGTPGVSEHVGVTSAPNLGVYRTHRTPETDARDNYYYNYYVSCYSYYLSRGASDGLPIDGLNAQHPSIFWRQTLPNLISEDPPGRRPLFDAVVAYTATIRHEEIPIDLQVYSTGDVARLAELGIKAFIDIIRGTSETLISVENFFQASDDIRLIFRWGLLQHVVTQILADNRPRVDWVNYLGTKAFSNNCFPITSTLQTFYVEALRHITTSSRTIPPLILDLRMKYDFLSIPGVDLVYFAFVNDLASLQNICYHILSNPRLEFVHLASIMVTGARLRGEAGLDALAADLGMAIRNCN